MINIAIFGTYEIAPLELIAKDLRLPNKDYFHPLSPPPDILDPKYDYTWKAYAVSHSDIQELQEDKYSKYSKYTAQEILDQKMAPPIVLAQAQIMCNLEESVSKGWIPVPAMQYPKLLIPAIRKYSNGEYIQYRGLILCYRPKSLQIGCMPKLDTPIKELAFDFQDQLFSDQFKLIKSLMEE